MKDFKFSLEKVRFSNNDIRAGIRIPRTLTKDLAYEIGVHIGDGHLRIFKRNDGWAYLTVFSGNYLEERDFYTGVICPLILKLYNKHVSVKKSTKNTVQVPFKSKAIATFKHNVLELPSGKKKGRIHIPTSIMNSKLRKYCLQGIVDTDFSLSFRHGSYPRITGTLQLEDRRLKDQIMEIFKNLGISATCCISKRKENRISPPKEYKEYRIDVNGRKNVKMWLTLVGFKNPKHITKLQVWEKYGYCPPHSSITQRKAIMPR